MSERARKAAAARAVVIRGRLADPSHIELDQPVTGLDGTVEVTLRPVVDGKLDAEDVFEFIAALGAGTRSKEAIDRQVAEERSSWGER